MEGDPKFVTSLPETATPSTQRWGGPTTDGRGRKRAFSNSSASMGGTRENNKSGRHEGPTDAAYGRVPDLDQAPEGAEQKQIGRDWLGTSRNGDYDVRGGKRGGSSGASSSSRVFVGELDKNANYSGSGVSGENGSAGVGGGKAKSSRWSNFV